MRSSRFIAIIAIVCSALASASFAQRTQILPNRATTVTVPAVAAITLDVAGVPDCTILLTGSSTFRNGVRGGSTSNVVIETELVALDLAGVLAEGGAVRLRAGSNNVGVASLGQITATNNVFPATSFFDVFAEIELPGGTNLVTATPLRVQARTTQFPPVSQPYTNAATVVLVSATDTNQVVGELTHLWLSPARLGRDELVGISFDVLGTNTAGTADLQICGTNVATAAKATIKRANLAGPVTINVGCDEALGTNLLFAAKWTGSLRAPDWRGFHRGNFILYSLSPSGQTNLFAFGRLEGSNGISTHRSPLQNGTDDCAACYRFEGKLRGTVIAAGSLAGSKIEATYAGEQLDDNGDPVPCCPPPSAPPSGPFRMTVDGVATTKCR